MPLGSVALAISGITERAAAQIASALGAKAARSRARFVLTEGMTHDLHCCDYVNRPYCLVRTALAADPGAVFERATTEGVKRTNETASKLRVEVGPLELGTDVDIVVREIEERRGPRHHEPMTTMKLELKASRASELFPTLEATLSIYPLSPNETQLELQGTYSVPLGPLGDAVDALVGHRVAHASVNRFVTDVAALLRQELPR